MAECPRCDVSPERHWVAPSGQPFCPDLVQADAQGEPYCDPTKLFEEIRDLVEILAVLVYREGGSIVLTWQDLVGAPKDVEFVRVENPEEMHIKVKN